MNTARIRILLLLAPALATAIAAAPDSAARAADAIGSDNAAWRLLDHLPIPPGPHMVLQSSSRNKTGHNGDENHPLYKDAHGDDVIFDAAGPGCVRSIWATHLVEDAVLNFYFDGEAEPRFRINEIAFFKGAHPAFPPPLNSYEKRGRYADGFAGNAFTPFRSNGR